MRNARSQISRPINTAVHLVNPVAVLNGRAGKAYGRLVAKYEHARPATGNIARYIEKKSDAGDLVKVQQPDYSEPRSLIALTFDNKKSPDEYDKKEFGNLVVKHTSRIIAHVARAAEQYMSMKLQF